MADAMTDQELHLKKFQKELSAGSVSLVLLRNLSAAGLLESEVEPSVAGPPRRYYRITSLGRQVLEQWISSWNTTRDFIDDVIKANTVEGGTP